MSRILITGGAGFIGTHLCQHMIEAGHEVWIIDRAKYHKGLAGANFIRADILRSHDWKLELAVLDFDAVYHLAAIPSVQYSIEHPVESFEDNCEMTVRLLEFFRQHDAGTYRHTRFIFMSSSSVYGESNGAIREDFPVIPKTPYAIQKLMSEYYCNLYKDLYKMEIVIPRLFNCYGPGQDGTSSYSGVISRFLDDIKENRDFNIFGDGNQSRDFVYVEDVCRALELLGETRYRSLNKSGSTTFNIATGNKVTINDLCQSISNSLGRNDLEIKYGPKREEIFISLGDSTKLRETTGWRPIIKNISDMDWKTLQ